MNIGDIRKIMEREKEELEAQPWYIRIPIKTKDNLIYFWGCVERWQDEIVYCYQRLTRGYSDRDLWNLDNFIIEKVRLPLKAFVKYQKEHGMGLPADFEQDPAGWLVVLEKMEYAFDSAWADDGYDKEAEENLSLRLSMMTDEERKAHFDKVQEGFELFGKYLRGLWD